MTGNKIDNETGREIDRKPAETTPQTTKLALMLVLSLVLGGVAAAIVWAFIFVLGLSYEYLWLKLSSLLAIPFLPLLICGIGGLFIGLWERYVWQPPLPLEQSLEIISKEKRFPYKGLPKTLVSSFLPLAFGGAVGPEAGLVNIVAGLCTWIGDKLKASGIASAELAEAGLAATLTAVFGAPIAGLVAPIEGRIVYQTESSEKTQVPLQRSLLNKRNKLLFYLAAVTGGLSVMLVLTTFIGGGLGLPRFERVYWQPGEILWSIPLALLGALGGYLFHTTQLLFGKLAKKMQRFILVRTVLCGLAIGLIGSFLPYTLFSGEEQMGELMGSFQTMGAWILIATGVCKLVVCPLCVNMGWRGGTIFPVIFAGISLGYGISLLTGLDPTFCITVLATSISAAVMRRPVLAIAVLLLCFPAGDILFMIVAGLIGAALPLPAVLKPHFKENE